MHSKTEAVSKMQSKTEAAPKKKIKSSGVYVSKSRIKSLLEKEKLYDAWAQNNSCAIEGCKCTPSVYVCNTHSKLLTYQEKQFITNWEKSMH
jgi:hypothetical protein